MRILISNTAEAQDGAGRAANRLHKGLLGIGMDSVMLVANKISDDPTVIRHLGKMSREAARVFFGLERLFLHSYPKRNGLVELGRFSCGIQQSVARLSPEIVHLHWINAGFFSVEAVKALGRPIVWTMHDMWPFTGGCHYTQECLRYQESCGACPQLQSARKADPTRSVWSRKRRAWDGLPLTVVTPSRWMARCAQGSSLFKDLRIEVIPNGIDLKAFRPIDKPFAREVLRLPQGRSLILFGAMGGTIDPRKGFLHLEAALQRLSDAGWCDRADVVTFGSSTTSSNSEHRLTVHHLGHLQDDTSLALLYSAADVFVAPSMQDNLPNTIMESLACGTPCVAFEIGGIPDLIEHEVTGFLAAPFQSSQLADGLAWILDNEPRRRRLAENSRLKAEQEYDLSHIAARHVALYEEICTQPEARRES